MLVEISYVRSHCVGAGSWMLNENGKIT